MIQAYTKRGIRRTWEGAATIKDRSVGVTTQEQVPGGGRCVSSMGRGPQCERKNLNKGGEPGPRAQGKVWRSRVWIPKRKSERLLGLGMSSRSNNTFILFL